VLFNLGVITFGMVSILGAINFLVTIVYMRVPGLSWGRLPIFVWGIFSGSLLAFFFTQAFAVVLLMVLLDRVLGTSFFNFNEGSSTLLYEHFFWFYSHPAIYVMVLPAMGVVLEILAHLSRKPLFAYRWAVGGMLGIVAFSGVVWAHHMFTSGIADYLHTPFLVPTGLIFLAALGAIWHFVDVVWLFLLPDPLPGELTVPPRAGAWVARAWAVARPLLPYVAMCVLFSWGMVFAAWLLLPSSITVKLELPLGTADRIARGEALSTIPGDLLLRRGDTLLVVNRDRTSHRIGELWVAPGSATSATVTSGLRASQSLVCSFHPGGAIGVSPQSRPGLEATALPTALPTTLLGVPLTLAVVVTLSIVRRLRVKDDPLPASDVPLAGDSRRLAPRCGPRHGASGDATSEGCGRGE
jgi:hypothetical protein